MPYLFLFIQLFFLITVFYLMIAFVTGAPFVPSTSPTALAMIKKAKIKAGDTVYDLGSGDGRLLLLSVAAGAKMARGLEINPLLVLYSSLRALLSPYRGRVTTRWQNFWKADLKDANIVYVYLLPWRMEALKRKLKEELKPGTRIVSNSFIFPDWPVVDKDEKNHVYVFEV